MFIRVDDSTLFTAAFGVKTAPPLLALSGWIGSWEDWLPPMALLSDRWRVVSYDHRGSGATVAPVESITFERLVADVFAVLDAHGIERCVLAAMSAGVAVALGAALQAPERVTGLALINGLYYRAPVTDADPLLRGLTSRYADTLAWFVEACVPEPDTEPIKRWGRQILDRSTQAAAIALHTAIGTVDLRPRLPTITQPTLILHGDADPLVSVESSQWLAHTLPNAALSLLPGAGHVPLLTRPQAVAEAIDGFFRSSVTSA